MIHQKKHRGLWEPRKCAEPNQKIREGFLGEAVEAEVWSTSEAKQRLQGMRRKHPPEARAWTLKQPLGWRLRAGRARARGFCPATPPPDARHRAVVMQITSPMWLSLPSSDWQLQKHTGLEGVWGGGTDCLAPFSYPAFLQAPPTLVTSGPHWPCLVPIAPLPATVSGHPQPQLWKLLPSPRHSVSPARWGPREPWGSPLEPRQENRMGHLAAPKHAS